MITFGQTADIKASIVGKWNMVKHLLVENGKSVDKCNKDGKVSYEFKVDGTYRLAYSFKYQGKWHPYVVVGKWRNSQDEGKIVLYNNKYLPPNDKISCGPEHELVLKKLTPTDFVTEEYWFSEGPVGTSYYKKQ